MHAEEAMVSTCAGCGAQSTNPQHWARRHHLLLCPECDQALGFLSDAVTDHVHRAERKWERLWQGIDEALDRSA